jgi:predicted RNase H-like HicB family nuclease
VKITAEEPKPVSTAGQVSATLLPEPNMKLSIECEREADGRWIAEIVQIPGAMAYGATREEAMARAEIVALRAVADRIEHGEEKPLDISITLAAA